MPTHPIDMIMLGSNFGTDEMRYIWSDENRIQRQLDIESALASAEGELGVIPKEAAEIISSKAKVELLNIEEISKESIKTKHSLVPTLKSLQNICGDAGEYIHYGATTQDVIDTGLILQLKEAHLIIMNQLYSIVHELSTIADKHKNTPIAGRTHGMQGMPTTFGFKIAVILSEIIRHIKRLKEAEERTFVGVLAGAVGTYASFGSYGSKVENLTLQKLELNTPDICWHSSRDRLAEYVNILSMISATLGKMAKEFYNL